jgi:hypothetical protein
MHARLALACANRSQMFGVTGAGLNTLRYYNNGGKRPRRALDQWDRVSDG